MGEGFFGGADTGRGSGVPMSTVFASEALEAVEVPSSVARNTGTVFVEVRLISRAHAGETLNVSGESCWAFVALSGFLVPEIGRETGHTGSIRAVVRLVCGTDARGGGGVPKCSVLASEANELIEVPSGVARHTSTVFAKVGFGNWTGASESLNISHISFGAFQASLTFFIPEIGRWASNACSI